MPRLSRRPWGKRILKRLDKIVSRSLQYGFAEQRDAEIAWLTAYLACLKLDPSPFATAAAKIQEKYRGQIEASGSFLPPSGVEDWRPSEEVGEVDGRKAWQWFASIRSYLSWRAGDDWRPLGDRYHPDRWPYVQAINCLNQAFHSLPQSEAALPCSRSLPPKKPPQRVSRVARKAGVA